MQQDANGNIVAKENRNLLRNTNNPEATSINWDNGGWRIASHGDGTGTILTSDDTPTGEKTVFKVYNNTTGNKDVQQNKVPYTLEETYILSGYIRVPEDSPTDSVTSLVRIWDNTANKQVHAKKKVITKDDGWVRYEYTYKFTRGNLLFDPDPTNSAYLVGLTGAGSIEITGMRLETRATYNARTFANTYNGKQIKVEKTTKGGFHNETFTFKIKAWKDDSYADFSEVGLTSIGNNEYTFTVDSNSGEYAEFDVPNGFNYEIKELAKDGWLVYSVDNNKNITFVNELLTGSKTHKFVNAQEAIDITIKNLDENGNNLANSVLRVVEDSAIVDHYISDSNIHISSLSDGTYTLQQVTPTTGYYKANSITFVVRDGKLFKDDNEIVDKTITVNNNPKPKFKFAKKDSDTDEFISNAWLIITRNEMPVASFHSTDYFYELYLDDGEYKLEEKIAPTGYKLASPISFKVENGILKDKNGNNINYVEMKDNLAKGTLTITKIDKDDSTKFLPDTKFRFWGTDYDGNTVEKIVKTDANGKIEIDELLLGEYHYQEIENPKGYELDNTIYDISLSSDASSHDEGLSTVTSKEMCEIYNSDDRYYYYDYDNGEYSSEKSYYTDYLGDGSLYVGGNAYSAYSETNVFDNDPDDFTKILPYGNVFINTDKLSFSNASILFPAESPFHLIKKGDKEIDVNGNIISESIYNSNGTDNEGQVCYLGALKSYIKDVGAPGAYGTENFGMLSEEGFNALINGGDKEDGTKAQHYEEHDVKEYGNTIVHYKDGQNIITNPTDGYVYKVVYQDATVLPDGSIGDLVLTIDEVIMESAVDKLENIVYGIQKANQFSSNPSYGFNNETGTMPATSRYPFFVYGPNASNKNPISSSGTYKTRNAIGVSIEWSVSVLDKSGNVVDGSISYSVKDLDLRGVDNAWGRVKGTEYAEGMEIISGSKSFAVMPYYDHGNDGDSIKEGYVFGRDLAINVERLREGNNADGLRFYTPTYVRWRDANGVKIGSVTENNQNTQGTTIDNKTKFESLDSNTGRYYIERGDYETFDSGFAVLLNASKSTLRWTGSSGVSQQSVNTKIFDSSAYVRLQQAHGTGGDLYIEGYDYNNNCTLSKIRRDVSMGIGDSNTLAILPQDGWEIEKITIDGETVLFENLNFNDGIATHEFNGITYTFTKDNDNPKKVRVTFDDVQTNHSIALDFKPDIEEEVKNIKAYGDLIINKTDKDTNEVMSNVTFRLTGTSDLNENISKEETTNSEGTLKFEHVPAGKYKLHEETPNKYQQIADRDVIIARDDATKEVTINIENEKIKYDLTINKKVTGDMSDINKDFDFNITIYNGNTPITEKLTIEKNGITSKIDNSSIIKLKHNETVIIKDVVADYYYKITENDTDYEEKYKIDKTIGGSLVGLTDGTTTPKYKLDENQTVTYINNKGKSILTGVITDYKTYIILISISLISSISYIIYKKKKKSYLMEHE